MSWGEIAPIERSPHIARWVVNNSVPACLGLPAEGPRVAGSDGLPLSNIKKNGFAVLLGAVLEADVHTPLILTIGSGQ
jgi:hypothetical protein